MGKTAVTKIIIWSVVAVLLIAMLVCAIVVPTFISFEGGKLSTGTNNFSYRYAGESSYTVGEAEIPADNIKNLDIDWISGGVSIVAYDGATVKLDETDGENSDYKLRYKVSNGTLTVKACKSSVFAGLSGNELNKELTIYLPKNTAENLISVKLNGISADFRTEGLKTNNITAETISGILSFCKTQCAVKLKAETVSGEIGSSETASPRLIVNTVSGNCNMIGDFNEIDGETVSGEMYLVSKNNVMDIDISSVSGKIILSLPETDGFKVSVDTTSGKFESDFDMTSQRNSYVYGDGLHDYHIETTSGDVLVKKLAK